MKNLVLFFSALLFSTSGVWATSTENKVAERNAYRNNNAFIFVENGITFSVYPDGEFDFYIDRYVTGHRNGVTFNSGFDYNPYVQYDDYGAVIQVEDIPVFYDYYGRVTQVGDVDISYNNGRIRRLGGMYVYYNRRGLYDYHTGYINVYNRHYVFRPFHSLFVRPALGFCLVFNRPYRRYYQPIRYTYYKPYRFNQRRAYVAVGKSHRYNKIRKSRAKVYRNDRRVAVRNNSSRRNANVANRNKYNSVRTPRANGVTRNSAVRSNASRRAETTGRNYSDRNNKTYSNNRARTSVNNRKVVKRTTTVKPNRSSTVTRRTVTRTPQKRTVTRSTNTYKPKRNAVSRSTVKRSSSNNRSNGVVRSTANTRKVRKAAVQRSRNTASRTSTSRSARRY